VDTQTFSVDASGHVYPGPPAVVNGTNTPQSTTVVCTNCLDIPYNSNATLAAITGVMAISVNDEGFVYTAVSSTSGAVLPVAVEQPAPGILPPDSGYVDLVTSGNVNQMEFFLNNQPVLNDLTWNYNAGTTMDFYLYFDQSDIALANQQYSSLTTTVTDAGLVVRGYNASGHSWSTITNATLDATSNSNDSFTIPVPNGSEACAFYAIAFPAAEVLPTGTVSTTPPPFAYPSTRAFNPDSSSLNPNIAGQALNKAYFYYSPVQPSVAEARIFDTAGHLVRDLKLGSGINPALTISSQGQTEFYFTWDGLNDSGVMVRNGLYLVRWTYTGIDGSHGTSTVPVALIK
jgi:hypothetical protein